MKTKAYFYILFATSIFLFSCAALNPSLYIQPTDKTLPWADYQEVKSVAGKIVPGETTYDDMIKMGLDPYVIPNTIKMTDVRPELLPNNSSKVDDLPKFAQACYRKAEKCSGYRFILRPTATKGEGSLILRWLRIKKKDITTGWGIKLDIYFLPRGELEFMIPNDLKQKEMVVVFSLFGGEPSIRSVVIKKNPLGFFGSLINSVGDIGSFPAPGLDVN